MKINRLLEITIILLNRGTITAKELAQRFEVSTRTIYRDVEELSLSGVPVYCNRGNNGGISLIEDYAINRTLLSNSESDKIIFALRNLQSTNYPGVDEVLEKLGALFKESSADWIQIDDTPWGSNPNQQNKFTDIKKALLDSRSIQFDYISRHNVRDQRTIHPLRLIYKGSGWYLSGYCVKREDIRLFRVSRMKEITILDSKFNRDDYQIHMENETDGKFCEARFPIKLTFQEEALYRLYDEYDDDQLIKNDDGTYSVEVYYSFDDWLYGYILSFGNNVKVESPVELQELIKNKIKKMYHSYF